MKKLLWVIPALGIIILSACNNEGKAPENQSGSEQSMQKAGTESVDSGQMTQQGTDDKSERVHESTVAQGTVELTGRQIVENVSSKLYDKLSLSDDQLKSLNEVLSRKFTETGGHLDEKYSLEISKKMGRDLRLKSSKEISEVLNAEQKEHFEKFMTK